MTVSNNFHFYRSPSLRWFLETSGQTILGFVVLLLILLLSLFFIPMYIYRWVISHVAPKISPVMGSIVNPLGHIMATEFIPEKKSSNPEEEATFPRQKCVIVLCKILPGTISLEEVSEIITKRWLSIGEGESKLRYPEFQQYLEMWMGYMFWKQDPNFFLKNHLFLHEIPEEASIQESEKILQELRENLLNKPFPPRKSPWEAHIVHNYRNPQLNEGKSDVMTVILSRYHHGMVDGYSLLYAIIEGLMGLKLPSIKLAVPKTLNGKKYNEIAGLIVASAKKWVYGTWRFFYDIGYLYVIIWRYSGPMVTPWHTSGSTNTNVTRLYGNSELIPVEKIKFIKNQLGVDFTSVLMSCLGAGAAQSFESKGFVGKSSFPIFIVVPLEGHPNKLTNHLVLTVLELVPTPGIDPVKRLEETDIRFKDARHFAQSYLVMMLHEMLLASTLAPIARFLTRNTCVPAILTNFPGPGVPIEWKGRKVMSMDSCLGGLVGVDGVAFTVVSYCQNVRVAVAAESEIMDRKDLQELIATIEREVDLLYERSLNATKRPCIE